MKHELAKIASENKTLCFFSNPDERRTIVEVEIVTVPDGPLVISKLHDIIVAIAKYLGVEDEPIEVELERRMPPMSLKKFGQLIEECGGNNPLPPDTPRQAQLVREARRAEEARRHEARKVNA